MPSTPRVHIYRLKDNAPLGSILHRLQLRDKFYWDTLWNFPREMAFAKEWKLCSNRCYRRRGLGFNLVEACSYKIMPDMLSPKRWRYSMNISQVAYNASSTKCLVLVGFTLLPCVVVYTFCFSRCDKTHVYRFCMSARKKQNPQPYVIRTVNKDQEKQHGGEVFNEEWTAPNAWVALKHRRQTRHVFLQTCDGLAQVMLYFIRV